MNSLTFSCDNVKGTMKLHSILATNNNNLTTLMVKDLAFFMLSTLMESGLILQWIGHWVPKILQPMDTRLVRNAMYDGWDGKWDYSVDGNTLTTTLEISDNFEVNVEIGNLKGVDFWVVCCTKPMHTIRKEFTDKWGTSFAIGDDVVARLYYQRCSSSDRSFVLLKDFHVVYMLCNVVCVAKFLMSPRNHIVTSNDGVYEMSEDTLSGINSIITTLEDDE
jgi:hypothetical protein